MEKVNLKKILIVRLSSLGDVILVSYTIRQLKNKYPNAELSIITGFPEVMEFNPLLKNIYVYDKNIQTNNLKLFKKEESNKININDFDLVVDLQNNRRSKKILSSYIGKLLKYNKNRLDKLRIVYTKYQPKNVIPIPLRYAKTLEQLEVIDDGFGLDFYLEKPVQKKLKSICIAPGAKHFTKRYPFSKYVDVCKLLIKEGFNVTLLGSNEDLEFVDSVQIAELGIENLIGKLNIQASAQKIAESELLITNDSALMHIAAGLNVPIVAIFGSTTQNLGFTPFRTPHRIIEVELKCRPCSHIGRNHCPKGHFNCMNLISPKEIVESVLSLIK